MSHRERFMQQVAPGKWVVACRICPKRGAPNSSDPRYASYQGGKASFTTPRACHEWWRQHVEHPFHAEMASPDGRARRLHYRKLDALETMDELFAHLASGCTYCGSH